MTLQRQSYRIYSNSDTLAMVKLVLATI